MITHVCNQVVKITWEFTDYSLWQDLVLYFPYPQVAEVFQKKLEGWCKEHIEGKLSVNQAARNVSNFLTNTGVDVGGFGYLPLTSSLHLIVATVDQLQTTQPNEV